MEPSDSQTQSVPSAAESPQNDSDAFVALSKEDRPSLVAEFWDFLKHNKKWWLLPVIVTILLLGALVFLGGGAAAPFIYTLF